MSALDLTRLDALVADFAAVAGDYDRRAEFPVGHVARLHDAGAIALVAPADLGGQEADLPTALGVLQTIARADPATALVLTMTWMTLRGFSGDRAEWPEHLRRQVGEDVLGNGALINSLRVEPDLGTPARGGLPGTVARRDGDRWLLSGRKIFSTGSSALTWMLVWARTDEESPRVGSFLVHRSAPGISIEPTWDHLGMRASVSHDVILDNVPTPIDHGIDLRAPDNPRVYGAEFAAWGNCLIAGIYDAVARSARDWFVDWANGRVPSNLGAPLSSLYRYQEGLGVVEGLLLSNRVLLDSLAQGRLTPGEGSLVKHLVTENAIAAVDRIVSLAGNPGLSRTNPLERHHRDVLCGRIHTPQADVVLGGAGRTAFASRQKESVAA